MLTPSAASPRTVQDIVAAAVTTTWVEGKRPTYTHAKYVIHAVDAKKQNTRQQRYFSMFLSYLIHYIPVLPNYFFQLSFCCLSLTTAARIAATFPDAARGVGPSTASGWPSLPLLRLRQHVGRGNHDATVGLREGVGAR